METEVYKIFRQNEWEELNKKGYFAGSEDDIRDGFIHFATSRQTEFVIQDFFSNERPIYVAKISNTDFLKLITWEKSESGTIFPHLFNQKILLNNIESFKVIK